MASHLVVGRGSSRQLFRLPMWRNIDVYFLSFCKEPRSDFMCSDQYEMQRRHIYNVAHLLEFPKTHFHIKDYISTLFQIGKKQKFRPSAGWKWCDLQLRAAAVQVQGVGKELIISWGCVPSKKKKKKKKGGIAMVAHSSKHFFTSIISFLYGFSSFFQLLQLKLQVMSLLLLFFFFLEASGHFCPYLLF